MNGVSFGTVVWSMLILVVGVNILEAFDYRLALTLVLVILFALFLAHAGPITDVIKAITPTGSLPPNERT